MPFPLREIVPILLILIFNLTSQFNVLFLSFQPFLQEEGGGSRIKGRTKGRGRKQEGGREGGRERGREGRIIKTKVDNVLGNEEYASQYLCSKIPTLVSSSSALDTLGGYLIAFTDWLCSSRQNWILWWKASWGSLVE